MGRFFKTKTFIGPFCCQIQNFLDDKTKFLRFIDNNLLLDQQNSVDSSKERFFKSKTDLLGLFVDQTKLFRCTNETLVLGLKNNLVSSMEWFLNTKTVLLDPCIEKQKKQNYFVISTNLCCWINKILLITRRRIFQLKNCFVGPFCYHYKTHNFSSEYKFFYDNKIILFWYLNF